MSRGIVENIGWLVADAIALAIAVILVPLVPLFMLIEKLIFRFENG